jgi:hypothetical protein
MAFSLQPGISEQLFKLLGRVLGKPIDQYVLLGY